VNATIVDTGIPPKEVDMHISAQDPDNKWWRCLYEEDGKACGKWFKRKENARSHVQNHMGDRQFQCNDCGKTFVRQHDMKRHAAIHKDDRPHTCPCGSKFARHDALTRHRQRGMCSGALPGYEKSEEEKPKRGRPKKERRPDQKTRTSKASKARQMDRENEANVVFTSDFNYGSPSSGMSDHSLPMTPPDTSDFDADAFINMANVDIDYNPATSSWRDTPPTSPVSTAAMKTISPHLLTAGTISPQPGAPYNMSALNRAVTPDPSAFGSSPYTAEHGVGEMRQASWSSVLAFHDPMEREAPVGFDLMKPMLDEWLATH
jgi:regulatory protein SWI5